MNSNTSSLAGLDGTGRALRKIAYANAIALHFLMSDLELSSFWCMLCSQSGHQPESAHIHRYRSALVYGSRLN